ncbi:MAG: ABC transporter permease subunit [Hyphomicrobiaceae bacterium]|nr:MAG: ABC transporter permease subunit [Hyphomicrobiaceae bacterium]
MPVLGRSELSLLAFSELIDTPGLGKSVLVSLLVGFMTTIVSLAFVILLGAASQGTKAFTLIRRVLSPMLAIPHVAVAVGLAFVIAPSGLLFRLWSSYLGGPARPPDLLIVNDGWGVSLMAGLVLKEVPFLFLMLLAALPQADADRGMAVARSLGYGPMSGWLKAVLPRVYPQIRLPVLAVLAYGLSVVDVALVLGPTTPPTLSVQILKWVNDPDLAMRFRASAGAVLQLALVAGSIGVWLLFERLVKDVGRSWIEGGHRTFGERALRVAAGAGGVLVLLIVAGALVSIILWSLAEAWRFPDPLPAAFTTSNWRGETQRALGLLSNSLMIAAATGSIALLLVIGCLEKEVRHGRYRSESTGLLLLYLPLLVPQIAFLLGLQVLTIGLGLDETFLAVLLTHLVFALPYVFLSLSDPWRSMDPRFRQVALTLGASPAKALFFVRLPMLLRACLAALAIGVAVSIGQFLATQLVAAARWPTITTEAVTVSSGGNRRILAIYALLQTIVPFIGFLVATTVPAMIFRHRKGMGTS